MIRSTFYLLPLLSLNLITVLVSAQPDTTITLYFPSAKSQITGDQKTKLLDLRGTGTAKIILISGFTDSVGNADYNYRLSYDRALSVYRFVKSKLACDSFAVNSFGESQAASSFDLRLNRRVELKISYRDSPSRHPDGVSDTINTVLDVPDIRFKPDLPVIEPASLEVIRNVAEKLKTYQCASFEISGYVNWTGDDRFKQEDGIRKQVQELSDKRARAIFELLADQGIAETTMTYAGRANRDLKFSSPSSDDEKRQNMRVTITVHQIVPCRNP